MRRGVYMFPTKGTDRNCILARVPAGMENLLVEVKGVGNHRLAERPLSILACPLVAWQRTANFLDLEGRLVRLEDHIGEGVRVVYPEVIVVGASEHMPAVMNVVSDRSGVVSCRQLAVYVPIVTRPEAFKLVKDAVVLVQVAELPAEVVVDRDSLHGPALHVHVPNLQGQIVACEDVPTIPRELNVGDGGDNLGEERSVRGILFLLKAYARDQEGIRTARIKSAYTSRAGRIAQSRAYPQA